MWTKLVPDSFGFENQFAETPIEAEEVQVTDSLMYIEFESVKNMLNEDVINKPSINYKQKRKYFPSRKTVPPARNTNPPSKTGANERRNPTMNLWETVQLI